MRLTLRALGCTTTVDKSTNLLVQNGRRLASIEAVKDVHLSQPMNSDGPPNWWIGLRLQGGRRIEVDSITDSTDASLIAAKLSTATGKPVRLGVGIE